MQKDIREIFHNTRFSREEENLLRMRMRLAGYTNVSLFFRDIVRSGRVPHVPPKGTRSLSEKLRREVSPDVSEEAPSRGNSKTESPKRIAEVLQESLPFRDTF